MKTVKIKFVGKSAGLRPEDNLVCYYLQKNGYEVVLSEEPDYVICDVFGNPPYAYCRYPQIRIFESGENYTPDFNVMDYAICRYPISFSDRCFYLPGCTNPGDHWHALAKKDRSRYDLEFLRAKPYFANFISGHDSEHNIRGDFFRKLNQYKRVEAAGTLYNNMPGGQTVDWLDGSKTEHRTRALVTPQGQEIRIDNNQAVFSLIGNIQEETHRFAITYHRQLRSKRLRYSELDSIPGIGPKRKQELLRQFKSLTAIGQATLPELERLLPKDAAAAVYHHFHDSMEE